MTDHSQPIHAMSCGKVWKARNGYDHNLDSRHFSRCRQKTHEYICYPRRSLKISLTTVRSINCAVEVRKYNVQDEKWGRKALFMAMVATLRDDREVSFRGVREPATIKNGLTAVIVRQVIHFQTVNIVKPKLHRAGEADVEALDQRCQTHVRQYPK